MNGFYARNVAEITVYHIYNLSQYNPVIRQMLPSTSYTWVIAKLEIETKFYLILISWSIKTPLLEAAIWR